MKVCHRIFRSQYRYWEDICNDAAEFASSIPPERLISVSQSCDHSTGVVVVWYYEGE